LIVLTRLNVGCGTTPTEGWLNFDNSPSIRLPRNRLILSLLSATGVVNETQLHLSAVAAEKGIRWAEARHLPVPDRSVEALYSSHMLEHLDRNAAREFLKEAARVLVPGGHIRIVVPDLKRRVDQYITDGDADKFLDSTYLVVPRPTGIIGRLKHLVVGPRHHAWMYDERSLSTLLLAAGFDDVVCLPPGATNIPNPGALDLRQREDDSIYVEAHWPS
jgi:SAM-dependent methyltransferase